MKLASLAFVCALAAFPQIAAAQGTPPADGGSATLSVAGDGLVQRSPDLARVSLTIVTDDRDATRSAGKNTAILNAFTAKSSRTGSRAMRFVRPSIT